jgi:glucosylceramidase
VRKNSGVIFADPDAAERGFKVTLAPRSFNTFVLD